MGSVLVDAIDALLPQTQCRRCGFDGCAPYAAAIAGGSAAINLCPPGGQDGVDRIAALVGVDTMPLDSSRGVPGMADRALIDEALCIGCTLCIQACPVDAIIGAAQRLHTVVLDECSGCGLCVAPCPVDCIDMLPLTVLAAAHSVGDRGDGTAAARPTRWRARHDARRLRLLGERQARERRLAERAAGTSTGATGDANAAHRQAAVAAAVERARARRVAAGGRD